MIIVIREQCLKLIWAVIIRCLGSSGKYLTDDEQMKPPTFIFGWLQHPSEGELSDPANRTSYQSCLQNSMSIISFVIDFQVEHLKHNINTTNNPFASKLLIKVYIDFLLENAIDIKTSIYLRCLKNVDQQQYDLARHSNIATNLLDFVDYCNDIHPTTKDISRI
ncbi:unnamed protein product [Rotaria magnacalcarata]|uniref:Uncharacterized protein n=1 Tax=Rotaria magnacalcarata TaxID=392030 RepID=A0A8S2P7E2_9BILA|nr:unnamed protein product [Rotaria magnacalcarata]